MPILLVFIILLFSFPTQALTCGEVPSCESLGFSNLDNPDCPADGYLYCPFDKSYKKCVVKGGINCKDHTLSSCPTGAVNCSQCGKGTKNTDFLYKITACKTGYGAEDPLNCKANVCEGYTLTICPRRANCSVCFKGSSTTPNYKFNGCSGNYMVAEDGQSCVSSGGGTPCEVGDVFYLDKTCSDVESFVANASNPPIGVVFYIEEDRSGGKIVNLKNLTLDSTTYTFDPKYPYSFGSEEADEVYWGVYYKEIPGLTNYNSWNLLNTALKEQDPTSQVYDGKTNTAIIAAVTSNDSLTGCIDGTYAQYPQYYARYCHPTAASAALAFYPVSGAKGTDVGEGNWYLPAIGELAQLYGTDFSQINDDDPISGAIGDTKATVNATLKTLGSKYARPLTDSGYWSSTSWNIYYAWELGMTYGGRGYDIKYNTYKVRVIMQF